MELKNVLIIGDSYSTFEGYIPAGYVSYYNTVGSNGSDVADVSQTWWHMLISETGANLVENNSWSGSTISYTGRGGDCSETSSFICRLNKLADKGVFEEQKIDTLFLFGGTNDSWIDVPLGEMKFSDFSKDDLYSILPAISCFLKRTKELAPSSRIVCIINTDLKEEITNAFKVAGEHYGVIVAELSDIDKINGHPTVLGMKQIKEQVLEKLNNC